MCSIAILFIVIIYEVNTYVQTSTHIGIRTHISIPQNNVI